MYQQNYGGSRSPPPLQHPKPTHPPFQVPDPPVTPNPSGISTAESTPADPHISSARSRGNVGDGGNQSSVYNGAGPSSGYTRFSSPPINASTAQSQSFGNFSSSDPYAQQGLGQMGSPPVHEQQGGNNGGLGNFGNFGFGGQGGGGQNILNDHTAQMGVHFGRQMAVAGGEYVEKNINRYLPLPVLKHYFNVSNSYVLHKLRLVLFPWRHKPWSRAHRHGTGSSVGGVTPGGGAAAYSGMAGESNGVGGKLQEGFAAPREDVNSPDLYIPVMSVVTYVLLVSVIRGIESRFHPEVLGLVLSRALGIIFFEFILIKLGCYLLNIVGEHTVVDLLAYSGYKFVGVILTLLIGLMKLGRLSYWSIWAYTTAANAFFLLRSLRYVVLPDPSSPSSVTITQAQRSRRIQFLFSIAVAQSVFGWFLILGIWN
ncbi:hypothetical protein CBS101457_002181 [Exobasidium rhododendri]|nr:hypothetical protein CBS101457_002181 [Exobasidium rhododendri]